MCGRLPRLRVKGLSHAAAAVAVVRYSARSTGVIRVMCSMTHRMTRSMIAAKRYLFGGQEDAEELFAGTLLVRVRKTIHSSGEQSLPTAALFVSLQCFASPPPHTYVLLSFLLVLLPQHPMECSVRQCCVFNLWLEPCCTLIHHKNRNIFTTSGGYLIRRSLIVHLQVCIALLHRYGGKIRVGCT